MCSLKKVFLEILQNLQEKTSARVSFSIKKAYNFLLKKRLWHRCFPCEFHEISKSTFSYRTPPVAASDFYASVILIKIKDPVIFKGG